MSFVDVLESDVNVIVAKASAFVAGVEGAVELVVEDIDAFFNWLLGQAPGITQAVETVTGLVGEMKAANVPLPASLATDLADINAAVAGLNAAAQASAAGASPAQAVIAGYTAAKDLTASVASLSSSIAKPATPATVVAAS